MYGNVNKHKPKLAKHFRPKSATTGCFQSVKAPFLLCFLRGKKSKIFGKSI